jgi:tRNA threonylcarbamoyladenosine biosynthesis protein TsaB
MIYILHLETSTKVCSVALSKDGCLVQLEESVEDGYTHGENLTVFITRVLEREFISPSHLAAISVASGPGSYTGLRIGVSTAKGLCYALKIPLIAIDSLIALFENVKHISTNQNVLAAIDARRLEVFSAIFSSDGNLVKAISADVLDENSYREFEPFFLVGDAVDKCEQLWENRSIHFEKEIKASANGQVRLAFQKFQANEVEDVAYFEPFYLKDFISTVKK